MSTDIKFVPMSTGTTNAALERISSIDPRLSRTNYFDGQLLQASDLNRDQIYLDERVLELGQVLGQGIAQGLETSLVDFRRLHIEPGLAVAPSGRVLQLSRALDLDLLDSAFIATLNQGSYRRFQRGLYAVVLQFVEVVDGVAEAYPADLATRRKAQVSSYAEGVEVTLVPLNVPFVAAEGLTARATLVRQLLSGGSPLALPTDEAVALGLLAIDRTRPLWLDLGLLRRPLRAPNTPNALQQDLAAHYQELLEAVLATRLATNQRGGFPASKYFRMLPPFGSIPKEAIDPIGGAQTYFPKDYDIVIAPVRRDDVAALIEESAHLAPMDLEKDADADVMVLVPLGDQDFALRARQLELPPEFIERSTGKLARINALALRLFALPQIHRVDTDADTWRAIWDAVRPEELLFVRRPPRTAETNVSAVVLATGMPLPPAGGGLPVDASALEAELNTALEQAAGLQATVAVLTSKDADQKKRIADLEQSLALGGDARLADALSKITSLDALVLTLQAKLQTLESGERNAAILATSLAAAADKITQLASDLEQAKKKIAELQATGSALPDEVKQRLETLTKTVADLTQKTTDLQAGLADGTAHLNEARLKIEELSASLSKTNLALDGTSAALVTRTAERDAAQQDATKLKTDLSLALDQAANQQAALVEAQKAAQTAQQDRAAANLALSGALKNVADLQANLNTTQVRVTTLEASSAALQAKADALLADLASRPDLRAAFSILDLATLRGADMASAKRLDGIVAKDDAVRVAVVQILLLADRNLDIALWPTLAQVAAKDPTVLLKLQDYLQNALLKQVTLADAMRKGGADFGVSTANMELWMTVKG